MHKIHETFTDDEFDKLTHAKEEYRKASKREKLTWHDYLLKVCIKEDNKKPMDDFDFDRETTIW